MTNFSRNVLSVSNDRRPLASVFGVGPIWRDDGVKHWCDGVNFIKISPIDRPIRLATLGDSTAQIGVLTAPEQQNYDLIPVDFPPSGLTSFGSTIQKMFSTWITNSHFVFNGGVGGETSTQLLARETAAASTMRKAVVDLLNYSPDVVLFRIGINDVKALTAASPQSAIDLIISNREAAIRRVISAGIPVIDAGIYGYDNGGATDADTLFRLDAILQINAAAQTLSGTLDKDYFVPMLNITHDATGRYLADSSSDGTHLLGTGGLLAAKEEAKVLNAMFSPRPTNRFDGTNLLDTIATMGTVNTGSQGDVAAGFTFSKVNCTQQNALVEAVLGQMMQTSEYVVTAAAATMAINLPSRAELNGAVDGEQYGIEFNVYVEPSASGPVTIKNGLQSAVVKFFTAAAGDTQYNLFATDTTIVSEPTIFKLKIAYQLNLPTETINQLKLSFQIGTDDFSTYGSHTIKLGFGNPRIVKLGQTVVTQ